MATEATNCASARPRVASLARTALRSTTEATVTPTTTKTKSAKAFSGCAMVSDPYGGVNSRLARRPAMTAARAAGTTPPINALASTPSKKISSTVDSAML